MDHPRPLFCFCFSRSFENKHFNFLEQINVKDVHPVHGAEIQTHDFLSSPPITRQGLSPYHWQPLLNIYLLSLLKRKKTNKGKETENGSFLKLYIFSPFSARQGFD